MTPLSAPLPKVPAMHHPWRAFRALTEWRLHWADLPDGLFGHVAHCPRVVTLSHGLSQAERRSTITHELEHIADPDACEDLIRRRTAERLIPFDDLVQAMVWAGDEHELAHELWVDVGVARDRLQWLTPAESNELVRRLDLAELRNP